VRPGELPGNEVRSVRTSLPPPPRCRTSGHLLERIPLRTTSTRIYVAPPAHVTALAVDQPEGGREEAEIAPGKRGR